MRPHRLIALILALLVLPHLWVAGVVYGQKFEHWSQARWDSAGLAPDPATTPEAVVQVYAARTWGWRGIFGVHSWLALKRPEAHSYERYDVVGWGVHRGAPAIRRGMRTVDGYWAGNRPEVLVDRRGPEAAALIERIEAAIQAYPYPDAYRTWPGPNSNTFTAYIGRSVPELGLELPPTAIGKDYMPGGAAFSPTPSGTGYQVSLFGLLGVSLGLAEGLEINLLGCTIGIDPGDFAIKLPGVGALGLS